MAWADVVAEVAEGVVVTEDRAVTRWGDKAEHIRRLHDRYPNMTVGTIAKKVGTVPSNVSGVLKRYANAVELDELRDYQANKADIFDVIGHRSLISITPEHMAKASALQLVTMAAICEDKARLVRGQATSISVNALLDVAQLIRDGKV